MIEKPIKISYDIKEEIDFLKTVHDMSVYISELEKEVEGLKNRIKCYYCKEELEDDMIIQCQSCYYENHP